jgi:hypothetical protein
MSKRYEAYENIPHGWEVKDTQATPQRTFVVGLNAEQAKVVCRELNPAPTQKRPVYEMLFSALSAWDNCKRGGNDRRSMEQAWDMYIDDIVKNHLPSGSGVDNGTKLDRVTSLRRDMLVFDCAYHHMNEHGMYVGWEDYTIFVKPSFIGKIEISRVTGRDRNMTKEYLADIYRIALLDEIEQPNLREYM